MPGRSRVRWRQRASGWEGEPASIEARQSLWLLLAATKRSEELVSRIDERLKTATPQGPAILELGRIVARWPDKQTVESLVIYVTTAYESLPETYYIRAQAALAVRASDRALSNIDQAIALKPDWEAAVLLKAQLLSTDAERTTELLAGYLTRHPSSRASRLAYARALIDAKRYTEARQQFEKLLAEQKDNPELLYSTGLQMGNAASGERYLKSLLLRSQGQCTLLPHGAEEAGRAEDAIRWFDAVGTRSNHFLSARARS